MSIPLTPNCKVLCHLRGQKQKVCHVTTIRLTLYNLLTNKTIQMSHEKLGQIGIEYYKAYDSLIR